MNVVKIKFSRLVNPWRDVLLHLRQSIVGRVFDPARVGCSSRCLTGIGWFWSRDDLVAQSGCLKINGWSLGLITLFAFLISIHADQNLLHINLGPLQNNQSLITNIQYQSTSKTPVSITDMISSCECLTILDHPTILTPGKTEQITLEIHPNTPGERSYLIYAYCEGHKEPLSLIQLDCRIFNTQQNRNLDCYVSAEKVIGNQITIVDTRPSDAFGACHIKGSLNIPLFAIKTKSFLKHKPVVLISDPTSEHGLEAACISLKEKYGFKQVSILYGGLNGWLNAGGDVIASPRERLKISALSDREFDALASYDDTWIVDDSGVYSELFPNVITSDQIKSSQPVTYIITSTSLSNPIQVQNAVTYVYSGNIDTYTTWLNKKSVIQRGGQQAVVSSSTSIKKTTSSRSGSIKRKGCGGCGG